MKKPFLITRPQDQSLKWKAAIEKKGGICIAFPCIEIINPTDRHSLPFALTHFHEFNACIFTSVNAVLPEFKNSLQTHHQLLFAIGPATAKKLATITKQSIIIPHVSSSEGLLEHSQLRCVDGIKIAIFTGENPKPLLQKTLASKGAIVTTVLCYARRCPCYTAQEINTIAALDYEGIFVTSKEVLNNLITLLSPHEAWLKKQPLLVLSDTVAEAAHASGFKNIRIDPMTTILF